MLLLILEYSTQSYSQNDLTPQASFILQYLPQLKTLQKPSSIFQPYLQEHAFQSLIQQKLYYHPIVDLKDSRNRALEAYQKIK